MEEKSTNDILKHAVDVALNEPVKLLVTTRPKNRIHAWLQKKKILPEKKVLVIYPIVLGNLIRISRLLLSIDPHGLKKENLLEGNYRLADEHGSTMATVIAVAIHNKEKEPPVSLVKFVEWNFTSAELLTVLNIVIRQMDISNFMTTIISARGLNILESDSRKNGAKEVSPTTQGRDIAPGTPSEES